MVFPSPKKGHPGSLQLHGPELQCLEAQVAMPRACHKPPMTGNAIPPNGDDWGMVYDCFSHIKQTEIQSCMDSLMDFRGEERYGAANERNNLQHICEKQGPGKGAGLLQCDRKGISQ